MLRTRRLRKKARRLNRQAATICLMDIDNQNR
jgi:hypothetical protein